MDGYRFPDAWHSVRHDLGVFGINQNKPDNGLASAGVVTASIWLLRLVGLKSAS
ncbi:hypothetical protein [Pseudomonas sichuanensis]|uniref:Uncharacterized protein n=1 Tax=Pseudomonas sichuanensis TaxID=2213015 RepID=A0ABV0DKX6_9PSED